LYISLQTLRRVSQFVDSLADVDDPAQADDVILPGLASLVSCEVVVYNEIGLDPAQGQIRTADHPAGWLAQADMAAFMAHVHEHPLINYINETGDDEPVKISDLLSRQQFHDLGIYSDFFRPIRVEHQIGFNLPPHDGLFTAIALNRPSGDFTEEDRAVLSVVATPLNRAMQRARSRLTAHLALETASSASAGNLTDREVQVLELAAQGRTNHAIARILDVSPRTIAKHLEHIYRKLGVTSRAAAVYRTARTGDHQERPGPARDLAGEMAVGPALRHSHRRTARRASSACRASLRRSSGRRYSAARRMTMIRRAVSPRGARRPAAHPR